MKCNDFQVFIVNKKDPIYLKGRHFVQQRYRKVWGTCNLVDSNDYATVVLCHGSVIANVNIQLNQENNYLNSELFFEKEHWRSDINLGTYDLAEVSGLAISDKIQPNISTPAFMMLILGLRILQYSLNIRYYTTVQHKFLVRILTKKLNLPFWTNNSIVNPSGNIPNDKYWQQEEKPRIYYLDCHNEQVVQACDSYFYYLNLMGIKVTFSPLVSKKKIHYSSFWQLWNSKEMCQLQVS